MLDAWLRTTGTSKHITGAMQLSPRVGCALPLQQPWRLVLVARIATAEDSTTNFLLVFYLKAQSAIPFNVGILGGLGCHWTMLLIAFTRPPSFPICGSMFWTDWRQLLIV